MEIESLPLSKIRSTHDFTTLNVILKEGFKADLKSKNASIENLKYEKDRFLNSIILFYWRREYFNIDLKKK